MTYHTENPRNGVGPIIGATVALWAASIAALSAMGLFVVFPLPFFAAIVATLLVAAVMLYFRAPALQSYIEGAGLRPLTALHVWRIPAALAFFYYGSQGLLPPTFVALAGWGDMIAGVMALAVVMFWSRSKTAYWAFHIVGMADFMLAVGTGLTFSLLADARMETIALFPMALIPLFGVTLSGATHIAAFHMLWRGRGLPS